MNNKLNNRLNSRVKSHFVVAATTWRREICPEQAELLCSQVLLTDFSAEVAAKCMNRLAKLSARFIGNRGFSIGIDDVTPAPALQAAKAGLMRTGCAYLHLAFRILSTCAMLIKGGAWSLTIASGTSASTSPIEGTDARSRDAPGSRSVTTSSGSTPPGQSSCHRAWEGTRRWKPRCRCALPASCLKIGATSNVPLSLKQLVLF